MWSRQVWRNVTNGKGGLIFFGNCVTSYIDNPSVFLALVCVVYLFNLLKCSDSCVTGKWYLKGEQKTDCSITSWHKPRDLLCRFKPTLSKTIRNSSPMALVEYCTLNILHLRFKIISGEMSLCFIPFSSIVSFCLRGQCDPFLTQATGRQSSGAATVYVAYAIDHTTGCAKM